MLYDYIVIGKGLIGSAAAKYLSLPGKNVAIIGPDEPLDITKGIVFSSHYDQARIQRIIGTDEIWTLLNQQAVAQYPSLQKESGIHFHTPVGCLYVNPGGKDIYLEQVSNLGKQFNSSFNLYESTGALEDAFPEYNFPFKSHGILEGPPAGFINPGLLIKAQLEIFKKNHGTIINDIVEHVVDESGYKTLTTLKGSIFKTKKALVSAGAFTNSLNLINKKLAFKLKSETTIWAKVSKDEAMRLKGLPSLLYEIDTPDIQNIYLIQPIEYPDGSYYLKMGANIPEDIYFETLPEIQNWFRSGDSDKDSKKLENALREIMPRLDIENITTKKCIVSRTNHGKPYIGPAGVDGLYVAAGGNGYSAMCSDALGKIASHLMINDIFPSEYSEENFIPVFSNTNKKEAVK